MEPQRRILVFGNSALLSELAVILRGSLLVEVLERDDNPEILTPGEPHPDVILVNAEQVTPEQFSQLIGLHSALISVDPLTYQLTILSTPPHTDLVAETARVIKILLFTLSSRV